MQWSTCSPLKAVGSIALGDMQRCITCRTCGIAGVLRSMTKAAAMPQVRLDVPGSRALPTWMCAG
jgi:hypothetical protein